MTAYRQKVVIGDCTLYQGDCMDVLPTLAAGSVDMVLCDLPYGTTQNKWDSIVPIADLWLEYKRICLGMVVLTAVQPFSSALVISNAQGFKYADVWQKTQATGHLNCKIMPLREHEDILVFCNGAPTFNPQIEPKPAHNIRAVSKNRGGSSCYGEFGDGNHRTIPDDMQYSRSVVTMANQDGQARGQHPTQKPVALMEYLLRAYSDAGYMVMDNTMGSGTTGVAAVQMGRQFTGIERDPAYFKIACQRIEQAYAQGKLFEPEPAKAEQLSLEVAA